MAQEVVRLYVAQLSAFFELSAPAVATAAASSSGAPPAFVPKASNSLTAGVWSNRILGEIVEAEIELNLGEIGAEVAKDWHGLLDSARWKFVEVICETWRLGASPCLLFSSPSLLAHSCSGWPNACRLGALLPARGLDPQRRSTLDNALPESRPGLPEAQCGRRLSRRHRDGEAGRAALKGAVRL
jgi:hypothetical protein